MTPVRNERVEILQVVCVHHLVKIQRWMEENHVNADDLYGYLEFIHEHLPTPDKRG